MSLYKGQEKTASVYHPDDSDSTKTTTYPATADFTIDMNIIRRNEDAIAILGRDVGEYLANVRASYTSAGSIAKGDKVVWDGGTYKVVNEPKYNRLFQRYKIVLKGVHGIPDED